MNLVRTTVLATAVIGAGLGASSVASAQTYHPGLPVTLTYANDHAPRTALPALGLAYQGRRDTWNTVLLISGIVFVVGLIQDDSTLAILGGAGVIVSLIQLNPSRFTGNSISHGLDLAKAGPVSFGFSPFGQFGAVPGDRSLRPSAYVAANFKF